jgi:hypothetical protein
MARDMAQDIVRMRKKQTDMEDYKHNYFLMFKQRILKQLKDEKIRERDQILLNANRQT